MTGVLCTCVGGGTDCHAGFVGGLGTLGASFSGCAVASEVDVVSATSIGDSVPPCAAPSATSAAIGPRAYEGKGALVGVPAALDSFPVPSVRAEASPLADFFTTCAQADVIGLCETSSRSFSCLHHSDYFVGWVCVWQHRMRFVVLSSAPAVIHTLVLLVSLGSPPPSMGQHVSTFPPRPEFSFLPRSLDWHAFLVHFLRACVQVSPRPRFHALVFLPFRQRRRLSSPTCSHLGFPSLFFPPRLLRAFLLLPTHLLRFLRLRNGRAAVGQHRLLCVGSVRFRHPNELRRRTLSDRVRKGNSLPIGTETIRWDPPREGKQTRRRGSDPKHPG